MLSDVRNALPGSIQSSIYVQAVLDDSKPTIHRSRALKRERTIRWDEELWMYVNQIYEKAI